MVPYFRAQEMEDAKSRLESMLSGEEATQLTFPETLKTEILQMKESLTGIVGDYSLVQREDAQARLALHKTKKDTVLFLQRIRQIIGAHLPLEEQIAVRRQYGLSEVRLYNQQRLLQLLTNIITTSAELEDETLKLSAETITGAGNLVQSLRDGLEKRRHFKAEKITLREERVTLIQSYRNLRTKVYAFLMENMPEGSRDPRLISFGFRPSNLRGKPKTTEEVTVVTEDEISEPATVVETETLPSE